MDVFAASKNDRHPTDLASLRGARLVTAQETEEGRDWNDVRIKALTGGDPITARFMRQDFFTFDPTFKILIAGNHKPAICTVDAAMRRRLHILPFTQQTGSPTPTSPRSSRRSGPASCAGPSRGACCVAEGGAEPAPDRLARDRRIL